MVMSILAVWVAQPAPAKNAAIGQDLPEDLTELKLEELVKIKVTSVAKKQQDLSRVAGAVYVVTAEEIRRSGATSIPEALRMVPGIQVARIDANKWAISSRGFNGRFANKLLVMIDGRTVYTPSFSGVYWDMQDTLMEDIDRIEVIRGPGATMWGANAVNGVINVITKSASETQGVQITSGAGNQEGRFGTLRYGGAIGDHARYRIFGKYGKRNRSLTSLGEKANDDWDAMRGGFRLDWDLSDRDALTFSGDLFEGDANQTALLPQLTAPFLVRQAAHIGTSGGHFLTRWEHRISDESDLSLRFSFDQSNRYEEFLYLVDRSTADAEFQHRFHLASRHEILWGGGFRSSSDRTQSTETVNIDPARRTLYYRNAFIQDEIEVMPESLYLTFGSKVEETSLAGFQIQPNARIMWLPHSRHSLWASASRAVRSPSRLEQDGQVTAFVLPNFRPTSLPLLGFAAGNIDYEPEILHAFEAGYRVKANRWLSLDLATFYNEYSDLRTNEPTLPRLLNEPVRHLRLPLLFDNLMHGETYGVELATKWRLADWWNLNGTYSWLSMQLHAEGAAAVDDDDEERFERESPSHQFGFQSYMRFPGRVELDSSVHYTDSIMGANITIPATRIPAYYRLTVRLGWRLQPGLDLSLKATNLLDDRHPEFQPEALSLATEVGREVSGKLSWSF